MNKTLIIQISILSLIVGAGLGLLAPVPYVGAIMLAAVLFLAAPAVMLYMIMDGKFDLGSVTNSIIFGALSGFCANITFTSIYALITWILAVGFGIKPNMFLSFMVTNSSAWLLITFILFIGILCATTNAFSAFVTHYIIEFIRDMYEKKHPKQ
ncbi:MAG: hypothetical protein NC191_06445 [Muribaculaceae bacterium]|nr:hypothetical protein [Muribaculaceae bacterium]